VRVVYDVGRFAHLPGVRGLCPFAVFQLLREGACVLVDDGAAGRLERNVGSVRQRDGEEVGRDTTWTRARAAGATVGAGEEVSAGAIC
jgi:hypothetical protein